MALIGGLALLAALMTGGYQLATGWASTCLAEVIVPDVPSEPAPTKPAKQKRQQQDKKAKKQNQQGRPHPTHPSQPVQSGDQVTRSWGTRVIAHGWVDVNTSAATHVVTSTYAPSRSSQAVIDGASGSTTQ